MSDVPAFFERFRKTRRRTLRLVESLSREQMEFSASSRRWSIGQVLDHLTRVDEIFRDEFDELLKRWKKKRGPVSRYRTLSDSGLTLPLVPDAFLPLFDVPAAVMGVLVPRQVRQALLKNRAVPAMAPERIKPRKGRRPADLRRELRGFLEHLERFFSSNPDVEWKELRYYDPLFGFTNLPGVMSFIASHEKRHQGQIRDVLDEEKFPAAA